MAHLTSQQLMAFLGLLASRDIEKNSKHHAPDDPRIVSLSARRNPAHFFSDHDPKIDFVRTGYGACSGKSGAHSVPVGRMDMGRQVFEADRSSLGNPP